MRYATLYAIVIIVLVLITHTVWSPAVLVGLSLSAVGFFLLAFQKDKSRNWYFLIIPWVVATISLFVLSQVNLSGSAEDICFKLCLIFLAMTVLMFCKRLEETDYSTAENVW